MTAVGWGVDPKDGPYWILKNSWGTYVLALCERRWNLLADCTCGVRVVLCCVGSYWGENGYMRIARGKNQCSLATQYYTAVSAPAASFSITPEDPQGYGQTKRCQSVGGSCQYASFGKCPNGGTKSNPAGLCKLKDSSFGSSVECCIPKGVIQKPYVPPTETPSDPIPVQPRPTGPVAPVGPVQPPTTPPVTPTPTPTPTPVRPLPSSQYGKCAVGAKGGQCIDVIACSDNKGKVYSGLCPGPKNIMCCIAI